jgi:large subunit ribosomal protein L7/L12
MAPFGSSDDDLHRRVAELEHRVAALERAVGRAPTRPPPGEPSEAWASEGVRRLVMEGNKIGAMKLLGRRPAWASGRPRTSSTGSLSSSSLEE